MPDLKVSAAGLWQSPKAGTALGIGGNWRPIGQIYVGAGGVWRLSWERSFTSIPAAPTTLNMQVCRDTWWGAPNPVPSTWTARATWTRAPEDADCDAFIIWQESPLGNPGFPSDVTGAINVGTADTHTHTFTAPPGSTRGVRFRVALQRGGFEYRSSYTTSAIKIADHDNRDPLCPPDPL